MSDVLEKVTEIIEPSLQGMGFALVRVTYQSGTLQIMAERPETGTLTIEDCTEISHTVSALLDVADPIKSHYMLEISSPGLERPLVRLSDYERFSGMAARVELKVMQDNRKRFSCILRGANGPLVRLEVGETLLEIPFADLAQGRLEVGSQLPAKGQKKKPAQKKSNSKSKKESAL